MAQQRHNKKERTVRDFFAEVVLENFLVQILLFIPRLFIQAVRALANLWH